MAAQELDYKKTDVTFPSYQLSRITQQSGGTAVTLSVTGGEQSLFELPASNAYNFCPSVLSYNYTIPVGAGRSHAYADCIATIQQLSLYTRSGLFLCDIPNFQYFTKVIFNTDTKFSDFITSDAQGLLNRVNTAGTAGRPNGGAAAGGPPPTSYAASNSSLAYTEPAYYLGGAAAATAVTVNIPLGQIKDTIFALDKNLYFGEIITLRIIWAPYTTAGFSTTNALPDLTGLAAAAAFNISNLNLYLAVEQNQDIVNGLKAQFASGGLSVLMDYVYQQKSNFPASTPSQNITIKYNRSNGRKLKRVYNSPFNGSGLANTIYDHHINTDGAPGTVISNYYTLLDTQRIQQFNVDCTAYNDWMINQSKLEGSCIQNANMYQYNWVHIDSWDGMKTCEHDNNVSSGLDLSYERKWDFFGTADAAVTYALNHYTFAVCEKTLTVSSAGITCI